MVGKYKRTSNRQSWSEDSMRLAIDAVHSGNMGWLAASKQFNVPQATLRRRAQNKNKKVRGINKGLGRFSTTFPMEMENELVEHIKMRENMLFGLTVTDLRKLAYEFAEANNLPHRFCKVEKIAGFEWLRGFRTRHPELSLRKPESTSAARAQGFNKPQVSRFFRRLEQLMEKYNFEPNNIYNVDESALSTVQKPSKIFATKGKKQVGCITSAERGTHTTVVCCMSAAGSFIPPALIFARKKHKAELVDDAPVRTLLLCQESGWMTGELFLRWLKHFAKYSHASSENRVLLILDGHSSHKYYPALKYAKDNGISLMCLPPHCTHRIQPLDVTFFGPLDTYYNQEIDRWLKANPGRVVGPFQIGKIFSVAYGKAATTAIACSGFAKTGIFPFNPDVFPDHLFMPSLITDHRHITADTIDTDQTAGPSIQRSPTVIKTMSMHELEKNDEVQRTAIRLSELSPPPKQEASTEARKKRRTEDFGELTSTPQIEEIKAKYENKIETERRKSERKRVTRTIVTSDSEEEKDYQKVEDDDEDDASCIYCNELYSLSKSGEGWIRCQRCKKWSHTECAGISKRTKQFLCDICQS